MALFRFNIQGAIPPPSTPQEQEWLADLRARLRVLKNHCIVVNEGALNAEHVTSFAYHICHHDEVNVPCEPEQEI